MEIIKYKELITKIKIVKLERKHIEDKRAKQSETEKNWYTSKESTE